MPALPLFAFLAAAVAAPPKRQVPLSVLDEVLRIETRFEQALAADCDAGRCTSGGCVYGDHAVADRPRARSLPGLTEGETGPGSVETQAFLTRAQCRFTHEQAVEPADVQALVRRLQARTSSGWTSVSVSATALPELPAYFRDAPETPEADAGDDPAPLPEPPVEPEPRLVDELRNTLLPHSFWMVGIGLVTLAAVILIWAARRVGTISPEEQALLAELAQDGESGAPSSGHPTVAATEDRGGWVAGQHAAWTARLAAGAGESPDPAVQDLLRHLLRSRETPLLAKAVLTFPDALPDAFPAEGEVATAKLRLAEALKQVREEDLPTDAAFYAALNRHALAARLAAQADTQLVRALREDFGTVGLASLVAQRAPRVGALLFALAPGPAQREILGLLPGGRLADLAGALLLSDRMDRRETQQVFAVLRGARGEAPLPPLLEGVPVQDQGAPFGATAALSLILPGLEPHTRTALFSQARQRFGGSLPGWYRGILTPDMLVALEPEARFDLLLSLDAGALSAWLTRLSSAQQDAILAGSPAALRAAVQAGRSLTTTPEAAEEGRRALARGLQAALDRTGRQFADLVAPEPTT